MKVVAVTIALIVIFYVASGFEAVGIYINFPRLLTIIAGLGLTLAIGKYPATANAPREAIPWYDIVLILSILPFIIVRVSLYSLLVDQAQWGTSSTLFLIMTIPLAIGFLEATRRSVGLPAAILICIFMIYPLICNYLPGIMHGINHSPKAWLTYAFFTDYAVWGIALNTLSRIVLIFIIFAGFLLALGAGEFLTDLANGLVGRFRGGPAKAAVVASGFMGSISGSSVANVVTTGSVTIPLMKRTGYRPEFAGAVEAVASNGGQIMPPVMGAVAFVMADFLQIPYIQVCFYAILPALLYFLCVFVQVDREAVATGLKGMEPSQIPSVIKVFKKGWFFILPVIVLLFYLVVLRYTAQKSAFYALVALVVIVLFTKRGRSQLRRLPDLLELSASSTALIVPIGGSIGFILGSLNLTGLGLALSSGLIDLAHGILPLLLIIAAIASFILGMGTGTITCYITLAVLVAPALVLMGLEPIVAHFFVFLIGISAYITPPSCTASYAAAALANAHPMKTGWLSVRLGILTLVLPFMIAYNPALMLIGSPIEIAITIPLAVVGIAIASAGLGGYLLTKLKMWERVLFMLGGFALLSGNYIVIAAAGGIILLLVLPQIKSRRNR